VSLGSFLAALPKAELHVHLEGAISPATLLSLARRRRVPLPADDEPGLREWFRFRDFEHFVEVYLACSRCLRDPEDFQAAAEGLLAAEEAIGVVHCEAHFTISTHAANGANPGELLDALAETAERAERERGIRLRLIPDIVRNVGSAPADLTLEWALAGHRRGLVAALGLSGSEARFPSEPFAGHFAEAARHGLPCVAHAGEHAGPASVRSVLALGAARIGHGVRSVEDPGLVAELVARQVPLEVCPTSNLLLGVAPDLASHPLRALLAAGVSVSIHSDDPALFDTDLVRELVRVGEALDLAAESLVDLAAAGFAHAFLPAPERDARIERLRAAARDLAPAHLGRELASGPAAEGGAPGASRRAR